MLSWNRTQPAGFFYKKIWHSDICRSPRFVNYNKCLRNTSLLLIGDSTLRQWYSFLEPNLSCRRRTEQWTNAKWHRMAACSKPFLKFEMKWIPHSQPCFMNERWMGNSTNLASISKVMDAASNNTRLVIVIQNYAHLLSFHYSVYQMRMRTISNSVRKLLRRNKNAKIFIKGPHTFYSFYDKFDYYGYLFKHIIYKEFKDLHNKVFFLDQTDMTIATDTRSMHPTDEVVQASVSQMLNHICPVT